HVHKSIQLYTLHTHTNTHTLHAHSHSHSHPHTHTHTHTLTHTLTHTHKLHTHTQQGPHSENGRQDSEHSDLETTGAVHTRFLFRHASIVTFSHHAEMSLISNCWVSMTTRAQKPSEEEAIPRVFCKQEQTPQCNTRS